MSDIRCPLSESAAISMNRLAVLSPDGMLRYGEFDQCVRAAVVLLERAGFRAGERVATFMPAGWSYLAIVMALLRLGAVICFVNHRTPRGQLQALLAGIGCRKIVAAGLSDAVKASLGAAVLDPERLTGFSGPVRAGDRPPRLSLERPATIFFAATRSGEIRPILHTLGSHYYSARGSNAAFRVGSGDRWLLSQPMHEVGALGIFLCCVISGAAVVVPGGREKIGDALRQCEITHASLTRDQLEAFLRETTEADKYPQLRAIMLTDGALTGDLATLLEKRGLHVQASYGLTEMASLVTMVPADSPAAARTTSGTPLRWREVRIAESGEVMVRGETLFAGYADGEHLDRPLDGNGWFATGDLGRLDADGCLTVTGRVAGDLTGSASRPRRRPRTRRSRSR